MQEICDEGLTNFIGGRMLFMQFREILNFRRITAQLPDLPVVGVLMFSVISDYKMPLRL